jgi:hypothetical protein
MGIPIVLGAQGNNQPRTEDKRIFWIFTNHRTAEESANLPRLTRTVGNNLGRYGLQLGFDAASNVLKEFWPDLKRKLPRRIASP